MSVTMTHSHLSRPHTNRINSLLSDKSFQTNSLASDNSLLSDKLSWIDKTNSKLFDNSFQTNFKALSFIKIKAFSLSLSLSSLTKLLVFLSILFLFIGCGGGGGSSNTPTVTTNAQTPNITVQPANASYTKDDTAVSLSITATVTDGGVLSYQWYSNSVNSNENGVLIPEATGQSYTPSTANEGTLYYYVVVTNTNNNVNGEKTVTVKSNTAEITVNALMNYTVKCFDENLDLENTVDAVAGNIDPWDTSICGTRNWYLASSDTPVTSHNLNSNINFYAIANIIEITTQTQLDDIRNNLSGKYILLNDINLVEGEAGFDSVTGWSSIGNNTATGHFTGIFNGNFHKITNLWINTTVNYQGLFGYIDAAQIRNLGVEITDGKAISGGGYIGAIAGYATYANITNSYVKGDISGTSSYVGGIAGSIAYSNIKDANTTGNINGTSNVGGFAGQVKSSNITNAHTTGNINGGGYIGGFAGRVESSSNIANAYATGNINGTSNYVGGFAGYINTANVTNAYATGNINGVKYAGGFTGCALAANIINSYATGDINGTDNIGGFVAMVYGSSITKNYAAGNVSGGANIGGIAGDIQQNTVIKNNAAINPSISGTTEVSRVAGFLRQSTGVTVSDNFALNTMSITGTAGYNEGTDKTIIELKTKSTYEVDLGWSFGDNDTSPWKWEAGKNNGLPYLYWQD